MRAAALALLLGGIGGLLPFRDRLGGSFEPSPQAAPYTIAMSNGTGFTSACQGTNPSWPGVTVAVGRATTAYCNKKGARIDALVVPGDLVLTDAGVPRIEPGSDGVLGYRTENVLTGTNITFPEQFTPGSTNWVQSISGGGTLATVTANQALAPDGTLTADLFTWSSTIINQDSLIYQTVPSPDAGTYVLSVYAQSPHDAGTQTLTIGANSSYSSCSVREGGYTRCYATVTSGTIFYIGCSGYVSGACTGGSVYLWGAQREANTLTTYAPSGVVRGAEAVSFAGPSVGPDFCIGATYSPMRTDLGATILRLGTTTSQLASIGRSATTGATLSIQSSTVTPSIGWSQSLSVPERIWLCDVGGTRTAGARQGGSVVTLSAPTASLANGKTTITLGTASGTSPPGVVSQIQVTRNPALLKK